MSYTRSFCKAAVQEHFFPFFPLKDPPARRPLPDSSCLRAGGFVAATTCAPKEGLRTAPLPRFIRPCPGVLQAYKHVKESDRMFSTEEKMQIFGVDENLADVDERVRVRPLGPPHSPPPVLSPPAPSTAVPPCLCGPLSAPSSCCGGGPVHNGGTPCPSTPLPCPLCLWVPALAPPSARPGGVCEQTPFVLLLFAPQEPANNPLQGGGFNLRGFFFG